MYGHAHSGGNFKRYSQQRIHISEDLKSIINACKLRNQKSILNSKAEIIRIQA